MSNDITEKQDDPVACTILSLLEAAAPGDSITPGDVARAFAEPRRRPKDRPDLWRRYLPAVGQQALHLAREGRIVILRKGKPANPNKPIKGLIRLTLPRPDLIVPEADAPADDDA
ncbi:MULTISPECIES: DUF3253 domain-containing protein [Limibacillus]|jgi:hypothetical protein|uniref:DUF3253 domain-containing protein n=1 Tax=Limibacillus halophilus TaxID=1579333 RepID=A0A839SWF1_9PROT|nr:DUF3253 domain-containing protein [Limibacillus halophilus]MBB3066369.1 hypothetical protein [Limibacillus halophilus]